MRYAVKCDDCKVEIRRTDDVRESYAGGRCEACLAEVWRAIARIGLSEEYEGGR